MKILSFFTSHPANTRPSILITDLESGSRGALGSVLGGGHNAQVMDIHELTIKLVVGGYRR